MKETQMVIEMDLKMEIHLDSMKERNLEKQKGK